MGRLRATNIAAMCLILVTAPAWVSAESTDDVAPTILPNGLTPQEQRLNELSAQVDAAGGLGLYRDEVTDELVVTMPTGNANRFPLNSARELGLRIRVEERPATRGDVQEIEEALRRLADAQTRAEGNYSFYFNPRFGKVQVAGNLEKDFFRAVLDAYPDLVSYVETEDGGRVTRHSDATPFYGGAEVRNAGTGFDCTTGFAVKNGVGTEWLMIPRHCFVDDGVQVFSPGNGALMGTTTRKADFPAWDLHMIGGKDYRGRIYRGGANDALVRLVVSAADPAVGSSYCHSGAVTFQKCSQVVKSLNGSSCDVVPGGGGCTVNLIVYGGGGQVRPGDSGAPFYLPGVSGTTYYAYIRGMVIAKHDTNSTDSLAHKWSTIRDHYGVTILSD